MHLADDFVEIIGLVKDDMTVKALTSIPLGKTLGELKDSHGSWGFQLIRPDMKAVNQVVLLSNSSKGVSVFT